MRVALRRRCGDVKWLGEHDTAAGCGGTVLATPSCSTTHFVWANFADRRQLRLPGLSTPYPKHYPIIPSKGPLLLQD